MKPNEEKFDLRSQQLSWDWEQGKWLLSCEVELGIGGWDPEVMRLHLSFHTRTLPPTTREGLSDYIAGQLHDMLGLLRAGTRSSRGSS